MGTTVKAQREAKQELDHKLSLSKPDRALLEELAVACAKDPSPEANFQYAFALSKSTEPSELRYAVSILDGLVANGFEHQVDCMYGAATALYLLGDYDEARVRLLSNWRESCFSCPIEITQKTSWTCKSCGFLCQSTVVASSLTQCC